MYDSIKNIIEEVIKVGDNFQKNPNISIEDNESFKALELKFNSLKEQYNNFSGPKIRESITHIRGLLMNIKANGPESARFLEAVFLPVCQSILELAHQYTKNDLGWKDKAIKFGIEKALDISLDYLKTEIIKVKENLDNNIKNHENNVITSHHTSGNINIFWKERIEFDSRFHLGAFSATERFLVILELIKNNPYENNFFKMLDPENVIIKNNNCSVDALLKEFSFLKNNTLNTLRQISNKNNTDLSMLLLETFEKNEKELVQLCGKEFEEAKSMINCKF